MSKLSKAQELVGKAREIKGSRVTFLREVATSLRPEITKIKNDNLLSADGKIAKVKELKEQASKEFMKEVALRKQAYQSYLSNAKKFAKETVEKNFVSADDATKAKFTRDFSELKFKMALKDEKGKYNEIKSFVGQIPNNQYASLVMENFYDLADRFSAGEHKLGLSKTFDKLKADFTPEEVAEAFDIIEEVDSTIDSKLFTMMMPGDNPSANIDYSIISEFFTPDVVRYYQNPEVYFQKNDEPMPVFVDPEEEKVTVKKAPADPEYAEFMKKAEELRKRIQNFGTDKGDDE
jgi:N-acetyl-beta-hexosaminidase